MNAHLLFNFKNDINQCAIPKSLNNPFGKNIPEIAKIAAAEFQEYIKEESNNWNYDFTSKKGKMFGVLVVQLANNKLAYLGAVSGKLEMPKSLERIVPSVFNEATDDYFINKGMEELTRLSNKIESIKSLKELTVLKEERKNHSLALQKQLFENYFFLNIKGKTKNVLDIFTEADHGKPPSAAGECAAPKLLNYAIKHQLKPVALAEFWWGNSVKTNDREHLVFYPACKDKCRPILEYMLDDKELWNE
tara:strand:+ start:5906 stop:6649 length:744 start_codon:yes stop_codon:yes gene_type:complete